MSMQVNEGLEICYNPEFLDKASSLQPSLISIPVKPAAVVNIVSDKSAFQNVRAQVVQSEFEQTTEMGKDDEIILDFGTHIVGTIEFDIVPVGSPPDAPLLFDLQFAEMPIEFTGTLENYEGWISKSWLQMARECIDYPHCHYNNQRRYSFRYLKLKVWDTSQKYKVVFKNFNINTVSAVENKEFLISEDEELNKIAKISTRTLRNCMQEVYEDGPKRDRRLWLGDLYIQALANYHSFNDHSLLKRCLYLFAGTVDNDKRVSANLFIKPNIIPDDTYLADYSLHFINTLADYCRYTNDLQAGEELYAIAKAQVKFAMSYCTPDNLFVNQDFWWAFFDWNDELNKATSMHGLFIYSMINMKYLASLFEPKYCHDCDKLITDFKESALSKLYNERLNLYESEGQISMHSQIWMSLAEVGTTEQRKAMLKNIVNEPLAIKLITPYAQHFLVQALLAVDLKVEAKQVITSYWGKMVEYGADTFWELFDPEDLESSPYGSHLANSYCHAWSCTPIYFIDKYKL